MQTYVALFVYCDMFPKISTERYDKTIKKGQMPLFPFDFIPVCFP